MIPIQATFIIIVLSVLGGTSGLAQPAPTIEWQRSFGGTGTDVAKSVKQTSDGGYIIGGYSFSGISGNKTNAGFGISDYWIVKVDANGNKQFDKTFGGTDFDQFWTLQQTTDGGYILGGDSPSGISGNKTNAGFGGNDFWVVKVDVNGNKQWDRCYGGFFAGPFLFGEDNLRGLQQTTDGGYVFGGMSETPVSGNKTNAGFGNLDFWAVKTDANGIKQWDKSFGGTNHDAMFCLQQTSDGGYIFGGGSESGISGNKGATHFGVGDFWVIKTDSNGTKQWDKSFGGSGNDRLQTLRQTSDDGYILGGYSESGISGNKTSAAFGVSDFWIVKTDSSGNKEWEKSFGGNRGEGITSVQQTFDGGFIIGGGSSSGVSGNKTTASFGTNDFWIIKTDGQGNKLWEKSFGGNGVDDLWSLHQTKDAGYILAGNSVSGISGNKTNSSFGSDDYWVIKLSTPLLLSSFSLSQSSVQAQLSGIPGTNYIFQASTNLTNWTSILTNPAATNGLVNFTGTNPPNINSRFYRALQKP